jgi:hypothetical protein
MSKINLIIKDAEKGAAKITNESTISITAKGNVDLLLLLEVSLVTPYISKYI